MLTIENLPAALTALGFKANGQRYSKTVGAATIRRNIKVPVPPLPEQKRLVAEVQALEQKIAHARDVIAGAPARTQAILLRYL